ncbi:MAG: hypothetical protein AB7U30_13625 [Sulfuricellaceae bacterium]
MAFKLFQRETRSYEAVVSIWPRGQLSIPTGTLKRFRLDQKKAVQLFFDDDNRLIGLKFTDDLEADGAISIAMRKSGVVVSFKPFLDYHEIEYAGFTRKFKIEYDPENDLYVFDPANPTEKVAQQRRGKKSGGGDEGLTQQLPLG